MGGAITDPGTRGGGRTAVGHILKVVVKPILLFGLEKWIVTPRIDRKMGGFYHRVDQKTMRRQPLR